MPESIRSFIAFDMNNDAVLKRLVDLQNLLLKTGADLKMVEPQNIHMTIRFLGDIQPIMVERVFDEMKSVKFVPFDVRVHGLGAFPNVHYSRVLWAGITEGADQLKSVFTQLEPRLRRLGFSPDSKGFSPHLTIARVKSGRNKAQLAEFIVKNSDYDFGLVRAECLKLKKSDLTPRGPIYSTLREVCPEK